LSEQPLPIHAVERLVSEVVFIEAVGRSILGHISLPCFELEQYRHSPESKRLAHWGEPFD
jgi:hypothetical protein